ncbi:MAG: flagellar biosynthetic protein FliO [Syntrophomonadaceae bacterium]|nr:flagellar biosynthetic protein FliO [Syntrophomonadaceae bacterium]MDD3023749.1 flagellar biosynthetic protein FliO [Syntrophomonadaceae bacterium]
MISIRKRYAIIAVLCLVFLHILAISAFAVDDIQQLNKELEKQQELNTQTNNIWIDFIKLIVILGLIIGVAWSLIRLFGKQVNRKMEGTWLHVVDEVMLGQNRGIVLCEIGEKIYALGVTDHNISFLFEVNNAKLLEEIGQSTYNLKEPQGGLSDIKDKLDSIINHKQRNKPPSKKFQNLINKQTQRLENISYKSMEDIEAKRSDDDV